MGTMFGGPGGGREGTEILHERSPSQKKERKKGAQRGDNVWDMGYTTVTVKSPQIQQLLQMHTLDWSTYGCFSIKSNQTPILSVLYISVF